MTAVEVGSVATVRLERSLLVESGDPRARVLSRRAAVASDVTSIVLAPVLAPAEAVALQVEFPLANVTDRPDASAGVRSDVIDDWRSCRRECTPSSALIRLPCNVRSDSRRLTGARSSCMRLSTRLFQSSPEASPESWRLGMVENGGTKGCEASEEHRRARSAP